MRIRVFSTLEGKVVRKNKGLMKAGQCVDLMHLQIGQNGTFNK